MDNSQKKGEKMNEQIMLEKMSNEFHNWLENEAKTSQERIQLTRKFFDIITKHLQSMEDISHIQAPNAVVEFTDEQGNLYRRYLELTVEENQNGLRLLGENLDGSESQIVYLSQFAIEQMNDLNGNGRNEPRCDSH